MSLTLSYAEIRREVGRFLGYGTDTMAWSALQVTEVADAITHGSRRFYYFDASLIEKEGMSNHKWSFLQDDLSVALAADTVYHALPSDFVCMAEPPSISGSTFPLEEISERHIRDLINAGSGKGPPQYYAIKRTSADSALSYRIAIYPTSPVALTLEGWYQFVPAEIGDAQAPIVTADHSETFLASILAAADEMLNPESSDGKLAARFKELLVQSIARDMRIGG